MTICLVCAPLAKRPSLVNLCLTRVAGAGVCGVGVLGRLARQFILLASISIVSEALRQTHLSNA
jgi:hypothetical protein